jgi:hypothetical protein
MTSNKAAAAASLIRIVRYSFVTLKRQGCLFALITILDVSTGDKSYLQQMRLYLGCSFLFLCENDKRTSAWGNMGYRYTAYTLNLESDWALPALIPTDNLPDVIITAASPADFPEQVRRRPGWHLHTPDSIYLSAPRLGLCGIQSGKRIFAASDANLPPETWGAFLISTPLNLLLYQRNFLLLHASVVVINGGAAAFLGASGWGKSTLAAAFEARGYAIIADDTLAVDLQNPAVPLALPAYPQIKLHPDALMMVGAALEPLPHISHSKQGSDEKRFLTATDHFAAAPTPLVHLFVLDKGDSASIERLSASESFRELLSHSFIGKTAAQFGVSLLMSSDQARRHLEQCTSLLTSVPMHRMRRRWSLNAIDEAVSLVEETIAAAH